MRMPIIQLLRIIVGLLSIAAIAPTAASSTSPSPMATIDSDLRTFLGPQLIEEMEQWDAAFIGAQREHADALAATGDPRSMLGAVLLYPRWSRLGPPVPAMGSDVSRWFADARAAAPDDALLAWIEATACPVPASGCDRPAALERLRVIDPGNTAVWLELMRDASDRGDDAAARHLFSQAANAERYDLYLRPLGQLLAASGEDLTAPVLSSGLTDALRRYSQQTGGLLDPGQVVDMQLLTIWNQYASNVSLLSSMSACRKDNQQVGDDDHQADCRAVFARMAEEGGTLLTRNTGRGVIVELTRGLADHDEWAERWRQSHWQSEQFVGMAWSGMPVGYAMRVLRMGEVAAIESVLKDAGIALLPPADWVSERERLAQ